MTDAPVLFLGDSLVEYGEWEECFPDRDVINLGVAGETVEGLYRRIDSVIERYPAAEACLMMSGINNIAMDDYAFLTTYRALIKKLKRAYPEATIVVHSILPADVDFIDNRKVLEMNRALERVAYEEGVHYLDLFKYFINERGEVIREYYLEDGVHLSERGYRVWCEVLRLLP